MRTTKLNLRCYGFTLVELLVVVGVCGLLLSILLPALTRVRAAAGSVACLSNLRQLGTLAQQQLQNSRGRYIDSPDVDPDSSWFKSLGLTTPHLRTLAACPGLNGFAPLDGAGRPAYLLAGEGSATLGWDESFDGTARQGGYAWNPALGGLRVGSVRRSVDVPLFADSARSVGRPNVDAAFVDNAADAETQYMAYAGYWIDRHRGAINVAFLDGHAEPVALGKLKLLNWAAP